MPRQPAANQQIRDERMEEILRAAGHVFARKGLQTTKIADIAALASVSHGLVYHYFKSKEEIYSHLVQRALKSVDRLAAYALEQRGALPHFP